MSGALIATDSIPPQTAIFPLASDVTRVVIKKTNDVIIEENGEFSVLPPVATITDPKKIWVFLHKGT